MFFNTYTSDCVCVRYEMATHVICMSYLILIFSAYLTTSISLIPVSFLRNILHNLCQETWQDAKPWGISEIITNKLCYKWSNWSMLVRCYVFWSTVVLLQLHLCRIENSAPLSTTNIDWLYFHNYNMYSSFIKYLPQNWLCIIFTHIKL